MPTYSLNMLLIDCNLNKFCEANFLFIDVPTLWVFGADDDEKELAHEYL